MGVRMDQDRAQNKFLGCYLHVVLYKYDSVFHVNHTVPLVSYPSSQETKAKEECGRKG